MNRREGNGTFWTMVGVCAGLTIVGGAVALRGDAQVGSQGERARAVEPTQDGMSPATATREYYVPNDLGLMLRGGSK